MRGQRPGGVLDSGLRAVSDSNEIFERALAAERLLSSRKLAAYRFGAVSVLLGLMLVFRAVEPRWVGPLEIIALYWVLSGAALWWTRRSPAATWVSNLAVQLIDMPIVLLAIWDNMADLRALGITADARGMRLLSAAFYVLLVMLSALSLDTRQIFAAAVVAIVCQSLLLYAGGPDTTILLVLAVTILIAAAIARYSVLRTIRMVETVSADEIQRQRLQRYFPPQVAANIEESGDTLAAGRTCEVTLLFCDIRDFTRLTEPLESVEVVRMLNDFHGRMVETIFEHGGTLDKFMGDGLMSYFGAPTAHEDDPERAVRCALAMQEALAVMNEDRKASGQEPLRMGIGVHTGTVVLGDIGAKQRRDYTAIGNAVNVASRVEQLTKDKELGADILVSEATRRLVGTRMRFSEARSLTIRGRSEPLACYIPVAGPAPLPPAER